MDPAPLTRLLLDTALSVQARVDASFHDGRLSLPRTGALYHLSKGPLPLSELAERLHCGRSNVTSLVDRLERESWIRREPDPDDRRVVLAVLTEEGRTVLNRALADLDTQEQELVRALGDEASTLSDLLRRL